MSAVVTTKNLNFEYDGKRVLHDMTFSIKDGDIVALVGPNGAGKSTLMRSLAGLDMPISGEVDVDGIDVMEYPREVHKSMGYLSDFFGLFDSLTVEQNLKYIAGCHDMPPTQAKQRIEKVIGLTGLEKYRTRLAVELSRGYRQRLGVAMTILHEPKILLLDEPASGMDPEARIQLSELFLKLKDLGMTLVVSSHILAELEDYCTSMLVIRDGRIVEHVYLQDDKAEDTQKTSVVEIEFEGENTDLDKLLSAEKTVQNYKFDGAVCVCELEGGTPETKALLAKLIKKKIDVIAFKPVKETLQRHYMAIASQSADSDEKGTGNDE